MFRIIRIAFLVLMGLSLVTVAIANRAVVDIRLLPAEIDTFFSLDTQISLPLYIIIYGGIVVGLLIGFVWEWIREARIRSIGEKAKAEVTELQREVKNLKGTEKGSNDDVLALLE